MPMLSWAFLFTQPKKGARHGLAPLPAGRLLPPVKPPGPLSKARGWSMKTDAKTRGIRPHAPFDPGSFLPPAVNREDPLLLELFEYTEQWVKRFYRARQDHDMQHVADFISRGLVPDSNDVPSPDHTLSDQLRTFVVTRLHQGVTLKDVAEHFGYSEKHCSNVFRFHVGESFTIYMKRVRLQTAKRLMRNPHKTMRDIAESIGFQDQFSFSHFFKKETGLSPSAFRNAVFLDSRT